MRKAQPMFLTTIRLPDDAKAFLEAEAKENASSQNSEIVRLIRQAMRRKRDKQQELEANR